MEEQDETEARLIGNEIKWIVFSILAVSLFMLTITLFWSLFR